MSRPARRVAWDNHRIPAYLIVFNLVLALLGTRSGASLNTAGLLPLPLVVVAYYYPDVRAAIMDRVTGRFRARVLDSVYLSVIPVVAVLTMWVYRPDRVMAVAPILLAIPFLAIHLVLDYLTAPDAESRP
ncbi:MAG: hypothetical protein ABEJ44_08000 [Halanaeroarchaeum sp.]